MFNESCPNHNICTFERILFSILAIFYGIINFTKIIIFTGTKLMIKKYFYSSGLFSNIFVLVLGTFAAQLIPLLLQSVLRRIYTPEDFGAIAIFISITGIFVMLSTLRYEMAIALSKKRADAVNLFFLALLISLVFNAIFFLIILIYKSQIAALINLSPSYSYILYFSPLSIFLFSSYQAINYYLVREKAFSQISINKISRRVFEGITQTGLGIAKNPHGLLVGDIVGHFAHNITGFYQIIRKGFTFRLFSFKRQLKLAKEYKDFPLINLMPSFFNAICIHIIVLLVAMFYGEEIVGYVDLTRLVLAVPAAMLTLSVSQVLLQNVSEKSREGLSIKKDIDRLFLGLSVIGLSMIAVILLIGTWAFQLYAGEVYKVSGVFAQILVFAAAVKIIVSPISIIFVALKKIKILGAWQICNFVLLCSLYFFRNLDIVDFLKVYAAIDFFSYVVLFFLLKNLIRKYESSLKLQSS